jgi:thiol-disulfide isomerase/thioredoxin
MISIKAIFACALLSWATAGSLASAEVTGQQRAQAAGRAILGAAAPRLVRKTIDGDTVDLGSLYGKKAIYLKFWATWCVPCREQMPHFQRAYETAGADLAVIAIDVGFNDSVEAIRAYRKKLGITMPIVFDDGSLGTAFHVRVTPTHIIVGRDGRIEYVGHLADQALDTALVAARAPAAPGASGTALRAAAMTNRDLSAVGIGDPLPQQSLHTIDGQRFELQPRTTPQKLTALIFLSPWCESYLATTRPEIAANCRGAMTQVSALAGDPHVRWLGIASGLWANSDDLGRYRLDHQVTIPLTLDASGHLFRAFRVNDVPTVIIADARGRVVRRLEGNEIRDSGALRAALGLEN